MIFWLLFSLAQATWTDEAIHFLNAHKVDYLQKGSVFHIKACTQTPINQYAKRRKQFDGVKVYLLSEPDQVMPVSAHRVVTLNFSNTYTRHLLGAIMENGLKPGIYLSNTGTEVLAGNYNLLKTQEVPRSDECIHVWE